MADVNYVDHETCSWRYLLFPIFCSQGVVNEDLEVDGILKEYFIPDYILLPGSETSKTPHCPACPVIVFINSKSGGQLGGELLMTYRTLLNKNQVFPLLHSFK